MPITKAMDSSMNNHKVITFIVFGCLLVLLHNCGKDQFGEEIPIVSTQLGGKISAVSAFNKYDLETLSRMCSALRSKRFRYATEQIGESFNFNVEEKECSGVVSRYRLITELKMPLSSGSLYFDILTDKNYFRVVQTNEEGPLAYFCGKLFIGDTVSPERDISPEVKHQLRVQKFSSTSDYYKLTIAKKDKEGDYIVSEEQHFQILTAPDLTSKRQGLEFVSSKYASCPEESDKKYSLVQTYEPESGQ